MTVGGLSDVPWMPFVNPMDDMALFGNGSDVDWLPGSYLAQLEHPIVTAGQPGNGWLMPYDMVAEHMVRSQRAQVLALMGALFSWRTVTVGQLRAGLCAYPLPDFDRDTPNLYGALARLGVISVGFSKRERFEHVRVPEVWLAVGDDERLVSRLTRLLGVDPWMRRILSHGRFRSMRRHARHNMAAGHVGLAGVHDPRVVFASGDGWGWLLGVDAQATVDAGVSRAAATDVVMACRNGVLAGVEVQFSVQELRGKMTRWARLLAHSPLERRGLLCVWLFGENGSRGVYPAFRPVMGEVAALPEMNAMSGGNVPVSARMGWARWDDWFDARGVPTGRFGWYTDMAGVSRCVFDEAWSPVVPRPVSVDDARDWGWRVVRGELSRVYGWDTGMWSYPGYLRGGFYGFAAPGDRSVVDSVERNSDEGNRKGTETQSGGARGQGGVTGAGRTAPAADDGADARGTGTVPTGDADRDGELHAQPGDAGDAPMAVGFHDVRFVPAQGVRDDSAGTRDGV